VQQRQKGLITAAVAVLAIAGAGVAGGFGAPAGAQDPPQLEPQLPDLVEATPSQLGIVTQRVHGRTRHRLVFRSSAENRGIGDYGGGDLVVVGHRPDRRHKLMTVDQYVDLFDPKTGQIPTQAVFPNVGHMRFVRSPDHRHWHFLGFERYELRRASDDRRVAHDRKTGFCLGNRYAVSSQARIAQRITNRQFDPHCGGNQPRRLSVIEGISVGRGDDYKPLLEGQYIDITKLPSGRYVLVHRVNATRSLRETNYDNDASSVLLRLERHGSHATTLRILRRCPRQARCPA
jgi:hypothetical protein